MQPLQSTEPVPLADPQLHDLLAFAGRLADVAGEVIRPYFRTPLTIDDKGEANGFDPVTEADRSAEAAIRNLVLAHHPTHGIYGEEYGYEPGSAGLTWVIDPIDGTRAFITGMPLWGTLIGLYDGARPVLGVMDQPYTRERFTGSRLGARLNTAAGSSTLRTRRCPTLAQAVLQTTHPDMFVTKRERSSYARVSRRVRLTRFGGDCYAYCMLAHGLIDLVIESGLAPYDIQALIPIIEAAGGVVSTWSGRPATFGGRIVAAGDKRLHERVLPLLASRTDDPN